jgi:hypothetical protein
MPLCIDIHHLSGVTAADDVAKAHMADLQTQAKYDVRYLRYWVNEGQAQSSASSKAPSGDAASTVHREAHGLVAAEIYQVQEGS